MNLRRNDLKEKDNCIFAGIFSLMLCYCMAPLMRQIFPKVWHYLMVLVFLIGLLGGVCLYQAIKKMIHGTNVGVDIVENQRTAGLDIVRVLACALVMTAHYIIALGYYDMKAENSTYYWGLTYGRWFAQCSCPLFMILSGYCLLKREVNKKHYSGIVSLLRDYFVLCILHLLFIGKENITLDYIKDLVNLNQYWYINMYVGFFLLVPFLNTLWKKLSREERKILLLVLVVLSSVPTVTDSWISNYWFGLYPIMYYYIGAWLREYPVRINKFFGIIALVGILFLQALYTVYAGWGNVFDWINNFGGYSCAYNALPTMLCSVLLFLLLKDIKVNNRYFARGLMLVSKNSLVIYLATVMFVATITQTIILPCFHIQNKFAVLVVSSIFNIGISTILGCFMSWGWMMLQKLLRKFANAI